MKIETSIIPTSRLEDWDLSAQEYDAYASRQKLYRDSAKFLVRQAELEAGMTIVDLACGSGVVTEAILRELGDEPARIVAVDFSSEMLSRAQRRIGSDKVEFHCRKAEELGEVVRVKVDRVICNAAFWHFDMKKVLAEIGRLLKPSGKCLISMPSDFLKNINHFSQLYATKKSIWMVMEEKELRGYMQNRSGAQKPAPPNVGNRNEAFQDLSAYGLRLERIESLDIQLPQRDYIGFLRIPIMARNSFLFRGVPPEEMQDILTTVANELEWMDAPDSPTTWQIYVLAAQDSAPHSMVEV